MVKSLIIAGVGGQGILLAANLFTEVLKNASYDVKSSEVHGMSQRGGDIISTVRWGKKVYSPILGKNEADYLLSLEKLEALRNLPYLKNGGTLLVNKYELNPLTVSSGRASYPENISQILKSRVKVYEIDAFDAALGIGNARVMNIVMLGGFAFLCEIKKDLWKEAMEVIIPAKHLSINFQAFDYGYSVVETQSKLLVENPVLPAQTI